MSKNGCLANYGTSQPTLEKLAPFQNTEARVTRGVSLARNVLAPLMVERDTRRCVVPRNRVGRVLVSWVETRRGQ